MLTLALFNSRYLNQENISNFYFPEPVKTFVNRSSVIFKESFSLNQIAKLLELDQTFHEYKKHEENTLLR